MFAVRNWSIRPDHLIGQCNFIIKSDFHIIASDEGVPQLFDRRCNWDAYNGVKRILPVLKSDTTVVMHSCSFVDKMRAILARCRFNAFLW